MDTSSKKHSSTATRPSRFTASSVAALGIGTYTDPSTAGLQLRVTARSNGGLTRSWLLRFRYGGKDCRILLGHSPLMTLETARSTTRDLREKLSQGIDPRRAMARKPRQAPSPNGSTAPAEHTVAALAAEFIDRHVRPRLKRPEQVEQRLNRHVLPDWGHRDARTIKPRDVIDLTDRIADRGSPVEANRVKALIGQMFTFGIIRAIVESTPVIRGHRPGGREKPRERVLSDDELRVILRDPMGALRLQRTAHAVLVLLSTGARRGELALAEWRDIDFKRRLWRIPKENSKNGIEHHFHLSDLALDHFSGLQRLSERAKWVMPAVGGRGHIDPKLLTRSIARCASRLARQGIAPFTVHDLRRTVRTGLARLGVRPDVAERVLNHKLDRLLITYDRHGYMEERRDALERWSAHLKRLGQQP